MKKFMAAMVSVMMAAFTGWYVHLMSIGLVHPTLATWIIFSGATALSLLTYLAAEHRDVLSGILNASDVVICLFVVGAVIFFGDRQMVLSPFEVGYLKGAILIIVFWYLTRNARVANWLVQGLICYGYIPTVHKMIVTGQNSESYIAWGFITIAGFFALYPALVDGKRLAVLYAIRTIVMTSLVLALMLVIDHHPFG